jgi:hypothetical protein
VHNYKFDVTDFQDFVCMKLEQLSTCDGDEKGFTADINFCLDDLQCASELICGVDFCIVKLGCNAPVPCQ